MADELNWAADLADEHAAPSFLVDSASAAVVAANAPALSLLGLTSEKALPLALDIAMPAIARLRLLARTGQTERAQDRLTFWINGSSHQLSCQISALRNGATSPNLYQVVVMSPTPQEIGAHARPAIGTKQISAQEDASIIDFSEPPRIERDDQETLREIAQRIRDTEVSWGLVQPDPQSETAGVSSIAEPAAVASDASKKDKASAQQSPDAIAETPMATREILQSLNKPIDIDLAKLAHELKTPISAIATASEMMRDERLGALGSLVYREYAADIYNSAKHALDVINTTLGRGQAGAQLNELQTFEINDLVSEAVSSLRPIARERNLDLGFDADPVSPRVVTSPTAVRQIVFNLLTNALKYTPNGGVVRAATGYLDDGAVFVVVRDTGYGFDTKRPKNMPSDRPSETTANGRLSGSYGIGLPLVRQLAEQIGADVEIDSAPGRGTVALIALPRSASNY